MSLKARIRRMENFVNAPSACAACRGYGGKSVRVWHLGEPEPPVPICPGCGRPARALTTIRIEAVPEAVEEPDGGWARTTVVVVCGQET